MSGSSYERYPLLYCQPVAKLIKPGCKAHKTFLRRSQMLTRRKVSPSVRSLIHSTFCSKSCSAAIIHRRYDVPERPTKFYGSLLQSLIARRSIKHGKQVHARFHCIGLAYNVHLATKLINLYSLCDCLSYAHKLFDRIPKGNRFLWNVLIRGYAWSGPYEAAISLFYKMLDHGLVPDNFTFPFVLKACSALSEINVGMDIHQHVVKTGWEMDVYVAAALVDMYAKCGSVVKAREMFDKILERDVVLWNSMLAAYSQNGHAEECLLLAGEMAFAGVRPTDATLVTAISASADIAAHPKGRELHGYGWRQGFESYDKVQTALVDMYAKCGSLQVARDLFERLVNKRVVSWNAMITGYAMHGHAHEALHLFNRMAQEAHPDHITFVGVLSACNHGGMVDQGRRYFEVMTRDYQIQPTVQHYTCMIDLLGHSNRLDEAYRLIMEMKVTPDSGVWGSLLNSCKIHKNLDLAELALEKLTELEPDDAGNYVILSNMYAQAGRWEGVARLRKLMADKGLKKSTACSWIQVKSRVHAFLCGDTSHPMSDKIYAELDRIGRLMELSGYVPNTEPVFHDVDDDEKRRMICSHSERLAIGFGLISTPPGTKLLITKNLRVCEDCHVAIKFISKITMREIIIRDVNRYHHFKEGACSCGDFW
ncbi:OLC1v1027095C1 [Oldenlandia corymbosa var. corymbosa]|uniref:OLC1v1027095C1 n=1 Tax=Oldenlandia corymbosa var. corymbosa TaxID=529605 RepID=A0AAV1C9D5_OLDCO|nr:OLC1v1027095C1 [Oldenlandia corymbosa var. corymbosa]